MNLWELPLPRDLIAVRWPGDAVPMNGEQGQLLPSDLGLVWLPELGDPVAVRPAGSSARKFLEAPSARTARVLEVREGVVAIEVLRTVGQRRWTEPLEVEVPDLVVDSVARQFRLREQDVPDWLREHFVDPTEPARLLMATCPFGDRRAFALLGDGVRADLWNDERTGVGLQRVTRAPGQAADLNRVVVTGGLRFVVRAEEERRTLLAEHRAVLQVLQSDQRGLISHYTSWLDVEHRAVARRLLAADVLPAEPFVDQFDNTTWRLPNGAPEQWLETGGNVEMAEASALRSQLNGVRDALALPMGHERVRALSESFVSLLGGGEARNLRQDGQLVQKDGSRRRSRPPRHPAVVLADRGALTVLRRQVVALEGAARAEADIPVIALAMGHALAARQRRPMRPRSAELVAAFGGPPTPSQLDALDVVLNTPDVAIIQGPPGTGKTRLLSALRYLLSSADEPAAGPVVLLTSTQQVAVDNLVEAGSALGRLPAARLRNDGAVGEVVHEWAEALAHRLPVPGRRASLAQTLRQLREVLGLLLIQGDEGLAAVRTPVLGLVLDRVSQRTYERLQRNLTSSPARDHDEAFSFVRRLRVDAAAFADDGPYQVRKLLRKDCFGLAVDEAELFFLEACAATPRGKVPMDLPKLDAVRDRLLLQLASAPQLGGLSSDVREAIADAVSEMEVLYRSSPISVDDALGEFALGLLEDPEAVESAVLQYTDAYAVTCSTAGSQRLSRHLASPTGLTALSGESDTSSGTPIATVLVDEAARSHPLDLLIPAHRASRRLVLVGDQRQLPHLMERESLAELTADERDTLTKPLFEILYDSLRLRERQDGVRRVATLTEQFRMHPRLGSFVSQQFYEPDVTLRSATPEGSFRRDLRPFGGAVAAWRDVPGRGRDYERGRPSLFRDAEVQECAAVVRELQLGQRKEPLSIAVMSFYAAQARLLREHLLDFVPASPEDGSLWFGTTDTAQGREFDVVVLSATRSRAPHAIADEVAARRAFGHLLSPNRLCVGFSRARRLVVLVGDRDYLTGEVATPWLPALTAFGQFADGEQRHVG